MTPQPGRASKLLLAGVWLAIALLVIGYTLPRLGGHGTATPARQIKDSTQVRGIHQGMVLWDQTYSAQAGEEARAAAAIEADAANLAYIQRGFIISTGTHGATP